MAADDVNGLPDVKGLESFLANSQDKGAAAAVKSGGEPNKQDDPNKQNPPAKADDLDLGQFKNPKDLLKAYKEIQGFSTRVAQERKQMEDQIAQMKEQMELMKLNATPPPVYQQSRLPQGKDFDSTFIENPQAAIAQVVSTETRKAILAEVLAEENEKNPSEFHERYAYAMQARNAYPNLVNSAAGVRTLFKLADKMRQEDLKRNAQRSIGMLLGDDVDLEKLKTLIKKDGAPAANTNQNNLAYMPDGTLSHRNGANDGTVKDELKAAQKAAAEKGDVDGVLATIFGR